MIVNSYFLETNEDGEIFIKFDEHKQRFDKNKIHGIEYINQGYTFLELFYNQVRPKVFPDQSALHDSATFVYCLLHN